MTVTHAPSYELIIISSSADSYFTESHNQHKPPRSSEIGSGDGVCENCVDRYTDFGLKRPRLGDGTTLTTVAPVNSKQR